MKCLKVILSAVVLAFIAVQLVEWFNILGLPIFGAGMAIVTDNWK